MVEFKPHIGELAAGYLGRLQNSNNTYSWKELNALRHRIDGQQGLGASTAIETAIDLLAEIAGIPAKEFCCTHTLLPFSRAVTGRYTDRPHGENVGGRLYSTHGLGTPRKEVVFCEDCRIKQVRTHGHSYWQRELQLPGIYQCHAHGSTLMAAPEEADFRFSPDRYADGAVEVVKAPAERIPVIDRYVSIARALLATQAPIATREAAFKLGQRAKSIGLRVGNKGQRATLEDIARDQLPAWWVNRFMPGMLKDGRAYGGPLQYATVNMPNSITTALGLALMFDSFEEAWSYWLEAPTVPVPTRREHRRYQSDFWTGETMLMRYIKYKGSMIEIAGSLDIEYGHVRQCLISAGLPSLSRVNIDKTGPALVAFFSGKPLDHAISEHGANREQVEEILGVVGARFFRALKEIL